jgi:hypothetical protein
LEQNPGSALITFGEFMALPIAALQALQQAGQGVHTASAALAEAVQISGMKVVSALASDPFSPEGEAAFTRLRSMARLSHELKVIEEKLREIFDTAEKLASGEPVVVMSLATANTKPGSSQNQLGLAAGAVTDMARPVRSGRIAEDAIDKRAAKVAPAARTPKQPKALSMSPNDIKVLSGLKKSLSRKTWKAITHSAIAQASGIPAGSVGLSLKRLLQMGKVLANDSGAYKLG